MLSASDHYATTSDVPSCPHIVPIIVRCFPVALDPGYAPAWLALGLHYSTEADFGKGSEEMYNKTVAALQRAHELDSDLLAASTMLIERRAFYEDLASRFTQIQDLARKRP